MNQAARLPGSGRSRGGRVGPSNNGQLVCTDFYKERTSCLAAGDLIRMRAKSAACGGECEQRDTCFEKNANKEARAL